MNTGSSTLVLRLHGNIYLFFFTIQSVLILNKFFNK